MKKWLCIILAAVLLAGCTAAPVETGTAPAGAEDRIGEVRITLSDENVGIDYSGNADPGVIIGNDIIYYEEGRDLSYGEGTETEAHSAEEAAKNVVVHITKPGTYRITGTLPTGQIAVDLGENAKEDPNAVVTLILDNADITCRVAPAVIFYNVYECADQNDPKAEVDTSAAGANVILADGSSNRIVGSHVAKIYEPGSEKKLHKYDGAFYSKMSMNIGGSGKLWIEADNEGLDSEMHLTINGGEIYIESGNDGINTNEDGVSVTTINGGFLRIDVAGTTGEGDGIDSNGWLVINGGTVEAYACGTSADSGVDADMGVWLNGGTVIATGNMMEKLYAGTQTHVVFSFDEPQKGLHYTLKDAWASTVLECQTPSTFTHLLLSSPALTEGTYTLWSGETQFEGRKGMGGGGGGFFGGQIIDRPDWPPRDGEVELPPQPTQPLVPEGGEPTPDLSERSEQMPIPEFPEGDAGSMPVPPVPEGTEQMPMPQMPDGVKPPEGSSGQRPIQGTVIIGVISGDFLIHTGANYFMNLQPVE